MNKLLLYGQIWLLTHQGMTEVFPFYFNQLSLKNTVNSKERAFLFEFKDRGSAKSCHFCLFNIFPFLCGSFGKATW